MTKKRHPKSLIEAIRYFSEALQINPTYADARAHLRMAQSALQR